MCKGVNEVKEPSVLLIKYYRFSFITWLFLMNSIYTIHILLFRNTLCNTCLIISDVKNVRLTRIW